jgi:uncharacterized membrane protein YphA (DoxX/SURF4 family)
VIAVVARIAVGLVFLVSGSLKLRDREWPQAAARFGTPRLLVPVVPWAEVVVGALLVAQVGGTWTAWTALVLLLGFTAAVVAQLARGNAVPCACFGSASTRPVDGVTVARNLALCALTLVAAVVH